MSQFNFYILNLLKYFLGRNEAIFAVEAGCFGEKINEVVVKKICNKIIDKS